MRICPQCSKEFDDTYRFCPEDGTPLAEVVAHRDPLVGSTLKGKYQIQEMVRESDLGRKYKASQQPLGRTVLVEVFNSTYTRDSAIRAKLEEAIRRYSNLQHPNIGKILDMDATDDGRFFSVSEFVDGKDLGEILKTEAPLASERVLNLFGQIADALYQAHSNLIEHGDLTPSDIVVSHAADGTEAVQILNFGISKLLLANKIRQASLPGGETALSASDVAYLSAEQSQGASTTDDLDDIYGFGAILYHALSGGLPFEADSAEAMIEAHATLDPVPLANLPDSHGLSPLWDELLGRCLKKDKGSRFQSIKEIKLILSRIREGAQIHAPSSADTQEMMDEYGLSADDQIPSRKQAALAQTFMFHRDAIPGELSGELNETLSLDDLAPPPSPPPTPPSGIRLEEVSPSQTGPIVDKTLLIGDATLSRGAHAPELDTFDYSIQEEEQEELERAALQEDLEPTIVIPEPAPSLLTQTIPSEQPHPTPPVEPPPHPTAPMETLRTITLGAAAARPTPPPQAPQAAPPPAQPVPPKPYMDYSELRLKDEVPPTPPPPPVTPPHAQPKGPAFEPPPFPADLAQQPPQAQPAPGASRKILIGIAAVIFMVVIVVGGLLVYNILRPKFGGISVRTSPAGAHITLDGNPLGSTPLTTKLEHEPGPHSLKLDMEGYVPITRTVLIERGKILDLGLIQMASISATGTPTVDLGAETVASLQSRAQEAFDGQRFVDPPEDSVLFYCDRILEKEPSNAFAKDMQSRLQSAVKDRAEKAAKANNWFAAEKLYAQLLRLSPDSSEVRQAYQKARDQLNATMQKKQEALGQLVKNAEAAIGQGKLTYPPNDNAFDMLQQIRQLDKKNRFLQTAPQRIHNLALTQIDDTMNAGRWDQAKNLLDAFNRCFPGDAASKKKAERFTQHQNELQAAARAQQDAENQRQQQLARAKSLLAAGTADYNKGNYASSVDNLEQAIRIDPRLSGEAAFYLGASYLELKNYGKAQGYFQRAVQAKPDNALAHLNLGILAQLNRNYDLAVTHLQKVIQLGGVPGYSVEKLQGMVNEMQAKKRFASLANRAIGAKLKHTFSSSTGNLVFTYDTVRFETNEAKDAFSFPINRIKQPSFSKDEFQFTYEGKKYKFGIPSADDMNVLKDTLSEYLKTFR